MYGEEAALKVGQIPGFSHLSKNRLKKERQEVKHAREKKLQDVDFAEQIPPILYVANKCEDGFEGEIIEDFYRKLPHIRTSIDPSTGEPFEPLFISAEHGDGLPDLFRRLRELIPAEKGEQFALRQEKRVERFLHYKQMLLDEIVKLKTEELERDGDSDEFSKDLEVFVKSWEKEFDFVNADAADNSDFDSDNEINPLDTLDSLGRYTSAPSQISADNRMKKKPI